MNWFLDGGADYARFRPDYPAELARWLAGLCPSRASALDVGCGSGQLTGLLAEHFSHVTGMDPSAGQLVHARQAAEGLEVDDDGVIGVGHQALDVLADRGAHGVISGRRGRSGLGRS